MHSGDIMSKEKFTIWDMAKRVGKAEQAMQDLMIQLSIQGYEELSRKVEPPDTFNMRVLTGNFGLVAELLEKHYPKQFVKEIITIMEKSGQMDKLLIDYEEILIRAGRTEKQVDEVIKYLKKRFGIRKSQWIARTRSPRTLVAADTKFPKMIPSDDLKRLQELKQDGEGGIILQSIITKTSTSDENAED